MPLYRTLIPKALVVLNILERKDKPIRVTVHLYSSNLGEGEDVSGREQTA